MNKFRKNKKGFTLIELIAMLVIIGVFMLLAIPNMTGMIGKQKNNSFKTDAISFADMGKTIFVRNSKMIKPKNGECAYFSLDYLDYSDDIKESSNEFLYDRTESFVVVKKVSNVYKYYVRLVEKDSSNKLNGIDVIELDSNDFLNNFDSLVKSNLSRVNTSSTTISSKVGGCSVLRKNQYNLDTSTTTYVDNTVVPEIEEAEDVDEDVEKLKVGDYIRLTPDRTSYTIPTAVTGYETSQTIYPSELTLWRIIAINGDGTYDAVSEYTSSRGVYFSGGTGFANFVEGLQTIASQYSKSGYTAKTRMMGYDGQTLTISNTYYFNGSINTPPSTTSTLTPIDGTGQEYSGGSLGDTLYLKDYLLVKNLYGNVIANKVGTTTAADYWIASRLFSYNRTDYFFFCGRCVNATGNFCGGGIRVFYSGWEDRYGAYAVRPIITLKSNISVGVGLGTFSSPYSLN